MTERASDEARQQLKSDWNDERAALVESGLSVRPEPRKELGDETVDRLLAVYDREGAGVGRIRLKEAVKHLTEKRLGALRQRVSELDYEAGSLSEEQFEARGQALEEEAAGMTGELGRNLRVVREVLGFTYEAAARMTGISKSAAYSLEKGRTKPKLTTLYQLALSFGLHPAVLTITEAEIETWGEFFEKVPPTKTYLSELRYSTTMDEMEQMWEDDHPDREDPASWADRLDDAIREVTKYEPLRSTAGALGAAIGRQRAGLYGAYVVAFLADLLEPAVTRDDLRGFRMPGPLVERALRVRFPGRFG